MRKMLTRRDIFAPKIYLPDHYDLVVGKTFELFYYGIMDVKNIDMFEVLLKCPIGKYEDRKFVCTPTAAQVGNYTLTIEIYDNIGNWLTTQSVELRVKAASTKTDTILCIGDSLTAGGVWVDQFALQATTATFIGSLETTNENGYEGRSGWNVDTFSTTGSPFYINGKVDFGAYFQTYGTPTKVYILLGWNSTTDTNYKAKYINFLKEIRKGAPNCEIISIGLEIPSKEGMSNNYGIAGNTVLTNFNMARKYVRDLDVMHEEIKAELPNVDHIWLSGYIDNDWNMIQAQQNVNATNSTVKEWVQTNGVHPSSYGSLQIGNAVYYNWNNK